MQIVGALRGAESRLNMDGKQRQPAVARAANAMIKALGGATVRLRIASAAADGLESELGITATTCQEIEVSPVVVRNLDAKNGREQIEVLMSSNTLDLMIPASGIANGMEFLNKVQAILCDERIYIVTRVSAERFAGVEYMYRLKALRIP